MRASKIDRRRVALAGGTWSIGAILTCVLLVSVLSVLGAAVDVLRPGGGTALVDVIAAWWIMLVSAGALGLLVGMPLAGGLVLVWVLAARHVPALETSLRGVLIGTATLGLVSSLIAYAVLGGGRPHSGNDLRALLDAAAVVGLSVWGGLALPRLLIDRLRPGALLCTST